MGQWISQQGCQGHSFCRKFFNNHQSYEGDEAVGPNAVTHDNLSLELGLCQSIRRLGKRNARLVEDPGSYPERAVVGITE